MLQILPILRSWRDSDQFCTSYDLAGQPTSNSNTSPLASLAKVINTNKWSDKPEKSVPPTAFADGNKNNNTTF